MSVAFICWDFLAVQSRNLHPTTSSSIPVYCLKMYTSITVIYVWAMTGQDSVELTARMKWYPYVYRIWFTKVWACGGLRCLENQVNFGQPHRIQSRRGVKATECKIRWRCFTILQWAVSLFNNATAKTCPYQIGLLLTLIFFINGLVKRRQKLLEKTPKI